MFQVNYSSSKGIVNKYEKNNVINLEVQGGSTRKILTEDVVNKIEQIITFNPQFTLREIKENFEKTLHTNFSISISTINRCLKS